MIEEKENLKDYYLKEFTFFDGEYNCLDLIIENGFLKLKSTLFYIQILF